MFWKIFCKNLSIPLKSSNVPLGVTSIKKECFGYYDISFSSRCNGLLNLENVFILSSVTSIEEDCFAECYHLKSITLPRRFEGQLEKLGINPEKTTVTYIKDAQVTATDNGTENAAAPNDNAEGHEKA